MTNLVTSRCPLRFAGPSLAVLVVGCVSLLPSQAAASCGDWLQHPSQKVERSPSDADEGAPSPCRGGECRRDRSQLPFAPPAPPTTTADRFASLDRTLAIGDVEGERLVTERFCGQPIFVPFAPERPPRV